MSVHSPCRLGEAKEEERVAKRERAGENGTGVCLPVTEVEG